MFPWPSIYTVLLDMDGTVLDLRFDNHFWLEHVPRRYGERYGLDPEAARTEVLARYRRVEGTLAWYCLDYWTQELGMDVARLKREVDHLIAVHPHALEFIDAIRASGKRLVLVTNAHRESITLKMEKTRLHGHFDAVICAHDLGAPKEWPEFWPRLQTVEAFDPAATLLVDDNLDILRTAHGYGIAHLLSMLRPDSAHPPRSTGEFPAVHDFSELLPLTGRGRSNPAGGRPA
jgi:putative hydrolase of the HAD superfamily